MEFSAEIFVKKGTKKKDPKKGTLRTIFFPKVF